MTEGVQPLAKLTLVVHNIDVRVHGKGRRFRLADMYNIPTLSPETQPVELHLLGSSVAPKAPAEYHLAPVRQLHFPFQDTDSDTPHAGPQNSRCTDASAASASLPAPSIRVRKLTRLPFKPTAPREVRGGDLWDQPATSTDSTCEKLGPSEPLSLDRRPPLPGQPVRLGATMLKLLKGYGITDSEIAQGIAAYAQKHCQSAAC